MGNVITVEKILNQPGQFIGFRGIKTSTDQLDQLRP